MRTSKSSELVCFSVYKMGLLSSKTLFDYEKYTLPNFLEGGARQKQDGFEETPQSRLYTKMLGCIQNQFHSLL